MATDGPGSSGHVATLFRTVRDQAGLSQRALADQLDIARTTLIKAEEGETLPTLDILAKLAQRLDVPMLVVTTCHIRDALRNNPEALRSFEAELAESGTYGMARAELLGMEVDEGSFTATVGDDGTVGVEKRWQGCRATRELNSVSFWLMVPGDPKRVSVSFGIENAPATMRWSHDTDTDGPERVYRVFFREPWKPSDSPLDFFIRFTVPHGYQTDRDAYEASRSPLAPPEKWPGRFFMHVEHYVKRMHVTVKLPPGITPAPIFGPPYAHAGKRPLDITQEYALEKGQICQDFSFRKRGSHAATLTVERPATAFSFGLQWVIDDQAEES